MLTMEEAMRQTGKLPFAAGSIVKGTIIEVGPKEIESLARPDTREQIVKTFKGLGYRYVSLDLEGYATGKMNCDLAQ